MTNYIIASIFIGMVLCQLLHGGSWVKRDAYQWWHLPWGAFIFSVLAFLAYRTASAPILSFITSFISLPPEAYMIEATYTILCMALWMGLHLLFRRPAVHNSLIAIFRKVFAKDRSDSEQLLPFPYFVDETGTVRSRVGLTFYRRTFKLLAVFLTVVYALAFLLIDIGLLQTFYPVSAFGMFAFLPILEFYTYLRTEVPTEEAAKDYDDRPARSNSNFDELWELYVKTFDNYAVAWKKTSSPEETTQIGEWERDNNDEFNNLYAGFTQPSLHTNLIIENTDIVSAFQKLERFFTHVENNGRCILIALDVPNHFTQNQEKSFTEQIAETLKDILRKDLYVYGRNSSQAILGNSIVVASLSYLSRQRPNPQWMKRIGLITVVNLFDKGVSNMFECRKFSYVLQSLNKDYQIIFVTPHRRGMQPSLLNTWLTGANTTEKRMRQFPIGTHQYFISYDYEDYNARFGKILASIPPEPLYSGSEMATLALSSSVNDLPKEVTPIHFLDLAYSNAIEGKEELTKYTDYIGQRYRIAKKDINDHFTNHLLPVDRISGEQVLAVIYDVENNVPVVYSKWMHLGQRDNFSIVIAKPYLLRDYFNANHDYFMLAPFAALQPHLCKSRLTLAIILLNMLQNTEMEEKKLRDLLSYYYDERQITSVSAIIRQLFCTYFSSDLAKELTTSSKVAFHDGEYHHQLYYNLSQLTDANTPSYLDIVTVKDESGNVLLDILSDLMYQNYDVGQIHSFSGKPYIIRDFNHTTRTLNVSSVNNSDTDILFYRAVQQIEVAARHTPIEGMNPAPTRWRHPLTDEWISIAFEGFEADVKVHTTEWYEFSRYTIRDCRTTRCNRQRRYPNGKVLKITFSFIKRDEYLARIDDIRKSLQILLYEAMQTVFPHHAQYLIISTLGDGDSELPWVFNRLSIADSEEEGQLSFYFIEDAHIDLGLIGALAADRQSIWYILRYLYDYLVWLNEGDDTETQHQGAGTNDESANRSVSNRIPTVYDRYLSRSPHDKRAFLKYGRTQLPGYFDIDLLAHFISDLFENGADLQKISIDRQSKNEVVGSCDFCGCKMKNREMQRLCDGRMRCTSCSAGAIDNGEQFLPIYDKVIAAFKEHLGIDFSTIPHNWKLVSAVELHRDGNFKFSITNGYDVREAIGLAFVMRPETDCIYVENGYKADETYGIIAHELTHIWEYNNPDFMKVKPTNEDLVEGLAVWTDLYLSEKNGRNGIERLRDSWMSRDDHYGRGLRFIMSNCPDNPYAYIRETAKRI
ncbi:MAG: hypothetical protein K5945_09755 [Bacteroidaceae bacterium]|nr:hypothetical protein [Bacteroidaceae bacterium]